MIDSPPKNKFLFGTYFDRLIIRWTALVVLIVSSVVNAFGQQSLPDSIQSELRKIGKDSARSRYLNNLAWTLKNSSPELSRRLCFETLSRCEQYTDCYAKADAMGLLGNVADNQINFSEAISWYRKALSLAQGCAILNLQASNLNNLGLVFQRQQIYDSAMIYLLKALDVKKQIGNRKSYASTLNNIGLVYYHQLKYRLALLNLMEALKLKEEFNDRRTLGSTLLNIANIYNELGLKDSAAQFLNKSIEVRKEFNDYLGLASSYNNLGIIFKDKQQHTKALASFEQSANYAARVGDRETLGKIENNRTDVYLQMKKPYQARIHATNALRRFEELDAVRGQIIALNGLARYHLLVQQADSSILLLEKALSMADASNDVVGRKETLKNLVEAKVAAHNQPGALQSLMAYEKLNDSVVYKDLAQELSEIQKSYEVLKAQESARKLSIENQLKDAAIANAQLRERQNIWIIIGLSVLIFISATAFLVFLRLKKQRDRLRLQEVQQEAKEQERTRISRDIHDEVGTSLSRIALSAETAMYLKNNSDQHRVLADLAQQAREVIETLSDLIWYLNPERVNVRQLFYRMREQLSEYLLENQIESKLELDVPDDVELSAEKLRHLHLIVKEAVHNAVKHAKPTEVYVHTRIFSDVLVIHVADNGRGFDTSSASGGNGLRNMTARAELLNGQINVYSTSRGTQVVLAIPLAKNLPADWQNHPLMRFPDFVPENKFAY